MNAKRASKILRGIIIVRYGMPFDTASPSIAAGYRDVSSTGISLRRSDRDGIRYT